MKLTSFFQKSSKIIPVPVTTGGVEIETPIKEVITIVKCNDIMEECPVLHYCMMFDGCSKGNPGPAGAGAVIYVNNSEIWARAIYVGNRETNNISEYTGLLLGLNEAVRRKIRVLTVKGDSEVVIKQMLGKYKVKSENLIDIYNEAKALEHHFDKIEYIHVYRNFNTRADALSNEGLAKVTRVK